MKAIEVRISGVSVLGIDGSGVDVDGLTVGSRPVIRDFIESIRAIGPVVREFGARPTGDSKVVVVHGFAPARRYHSSSGETWLLDELLSIRHSLREALAASFLDKIPSIFLGSGDCCSPVLDVARMCEMRVWMDQTSVLRGSPALWADGLLGSNAYPGLVPSGQLLKSRWEISVDGAQKVGFLDGCFDDPSSADAATGAAGDILTNVIQRLAPMLRGMARGAVQQPLPTGDPRFRDILARSRFKAAKVSEGSSRNLLTSLIRQPDDEGAAELGSVFLAMNRGRDPWVDSGSVSTRPPVPDLPVLAPQVFGAVVDLSEGILAPGYLMDLARHKGLVFLTAMKSDRLPSRLEAQKYAMASRLGTAKAQSFWDRNVISCAPGELDPDRLSVPLVRPTGDRSVDLVIPREGKWTLDLMPSLAGALAPVADGWRMVPAVVRSGEFPGADPSKWVNQRPGLIAVLRVFAGGVIFCESLDLQSFRHLFHFLLAWQSVQSGWAPEDVWKDLVANGWVLDDLGIFRRPLEDGGMVVSRPSARAPRGGRAPLPLSCVNMHARILAGCLARGFSDDPAGRAILLDVLGIPSPEMATLSGDEKPVNIESTGLCGKNGVSFMALSPWRPATPLTGIRYVGVELPGTTSRQSAVETHVRSCVSQMPQRIIDTVSKFTQIDSAFWLNGIMNDH